MQILRDDVVKLCVALGFKAAAQWNKPKLMAKLKDIVELGRDGIDLNDAKLEKTLKTIVDANGDVDVVQVIINEETVTETPTVTEEKITEPATPTVQIEKKQDKSEEAKPKTSSVSRVTRVQSAAIAIQSLTDTSTIDELTKKADDAFTNGGGAPNMEASKMNIVWAVDLLSHLGQVKRDGKNVTKV